MRLNLVVFCSLAFLLCIGGVSGEVFTSVASMEALWYSEKYMLSSLKRYIKAIEKNMNKIRRIVTEFEVEHKQASRGIEDYLSNPINAYLLTKRLTTDWSEAEALMIDNVGQRILSDLDDYLYEYNIPLPTEEDLRGAALAITRLQRTYKLKTSNVAEGEVKGIRGNNRFTSSDCFELGKQSFFNGDNEYSELWIKEALHVNYKEVNKTTNIVDMLEYLAKVNYRQGNYNDTLKIIKKVLDIDPGHKEALDSRKECRKKLKESKENDQNLKLLEEDLRDTYQKLCRHEGTLSEKVKARLKCRYVDFGRPFFKLGKLKEEEAFLDPRIVIYHDIVYEREINVIKALSLPYLDRAEVDSEGDEKGGAVDYRISEVAWLSDLSHPCVTAVVKRVEFITNLDLRTAESLQVLNYGIGGHYEPHFDFSFDEVNEITPAGRRIATMLFYLSDVTLGGSTVFTELNVTVPPKKGSAVLWYNLLKNGTADLRTGHAACPVLLGSKWVCTKWLNERGQEFRRPCDLVREL